MNDLLQRLASLSPSKRELLVRLLQQKSGNEPIAIVGMACRLPGAPDLDSYWRLIIEGRSAVTEVPPSRWDVDRFYAAEETPGKMTTRWGAFVDDVDQFDPAFFGIAPREASRMDPQQRLLLEVAWEAIENALIPADKLAGEKVGVFVGIGGTDYSKIPSHYRDYFEQIDAHVGTGNALSIAANRLSYILNLKGPSLAVDTACSSGLIATHLAIQSLRRGESDAALAGGVNLILSPETTIAFSKARMLSPDGVCRPFDAAANGYVRGEGCGLVLLKRLADAHRDGDPVLAVIRGSAANQDGRTSGITAPNGESQKTLIRTALEDAGLKLDDVGYIEAHGTGTPLGDPIEVRALSDLFLRESEEQPLCRFASVKGNIGHTETVSGVAGLIKTVLMMQHEVIPPQANFTEINPHVDLAGTRLEVAAQATAWPASGGRRVAGVSSFGFGGANVHLLLEAAEPPPLESQAATSSRPAELLTVSARTPQALADQCGRYAQAAIDLPDASLAEFCAAATGGRSTFNHRAAVVARTPGEMAEALRSVAEGEPAGRVYIGQADGTKRPKVAFLFTGQGSQQPGMGHALYDSEPVFRAALDECDQLLRPHLATPLLEVLYGAEGDATERLNDTAYTQPALFAVQYALTSLWKSWGVTPDLVLGHSVGEYAAACATGVMSLEDGARLIATRGKLIGALPAGGQMASLRVGGLDARKKLALHNGKVAIAALNGPESTVLSGAAEAVEAIAKEFEQQGVATQMLNVSHAFHSPLMEPVLEAFQSVAEEVAYSAPTATFISTLLAQRVENGELNAGYWRRHIRDAVRFEEGMARLMQEEPHVVLEIGPAPQLLSMARRFVTAGDVAWLPSLRPGMDDHAVMLGSAAELFTRGARVGYYPHARSRATLSVRLPNYPFQRSRLWLDVDESRRGTPGVGSALGGAAPPLNPLVGHETPLAGDRTVFETSLNAAELDYLQDHRVQGSVVLPAAAYLEQALAIGRREFGDEPFEVANLAIDQALFFTPAADGAEPISATSPTIQTHVLNQAGVVNVSVHSGRTDSAAGDTAEATPTAIIEWKRHATAELLPAATSPDPQSFDRQALENDCFDHQTREAFYKLMDSRGLSYGPAFQGLGEVRRGQKHAVAEVQLPASAAERLAAGLLDPVLGDACLQATAAVVPLEPDGSYCPSTYMPTRVDHFRLTGDPAEVKRLHVVRTAPESSDPRPETVTADVWLLDEMNTAIGEFKGVRLLRVDRHATETQSDLADAIYQISWTPAPLAPAMDGSLGAEGAKGSWVLIADRSDLALELVNQLTQRGGECTVVAADELEPIRQAITTAGASLRCVIDLAAVAAASDGVDDSHCNRALAVTQCLARAGLAKSPALTFVTRGGQAVSDADASVSPAAAAMWGFGRVAANEHPELACRLIDLDPAAAQDDGAVSVLFEVLSGGDERQIAIRNGARYAARLERSPDLLTKPVAESLTPPGDSAYRVELGAAGSFDGLAVRPVQRTRPPAGQVEVAVGATGLNFSDVLKALGLYPGIKDEVVPIGIECAGVVTAVGEGVDRFAVGDRVMGVAPYSFGSHATTAAHALAPTPSSLTDEEAATIPIAFLTAYHALVRLAGLAPGERVLIHAGAGGVGLAAIQIAQHLGAEIYTTAGSDHKRDFLRGLGVEHVYDSRSLDFAAEIRRDTHQQGVDVVLNSLPGPAIRESLRLLRAYGRFLEIGKTDIYADRALGLAPFQDNLSYFAIDLDRVLRQRGAYIEGLFSEVAELFDLGALRPLELTRFDFADTREAFRYMAQRKNIGKVVVSKAERQAKQGKASNELSALDGAWLVTGGLGALGMQVADWLAGKGVRRIGLLSRREPTGDALNAIERLAQRGVEAIALRGNVLDRPSLDAAVARLEIDGVPLTGVVHAAGVLDDGVLYDMTPQQLSRAMAPKTIGAWNLHEATLTAPITEFVLFSSIACQLGSPGQANYAAGNAYLDGLAHRRRGQGLPARSVNWGPWSSGGMASQAGRDEGLAARGMHSIEPSLAFAALDRMVASGVTQVSVMLPDWKQMLSGVRQVPALLKQIASELNTQSAAAAGVDQKLRGELLAATGADRAAKLQAFFLDQLAKIMGLAASEVDPTQPLNTLGLDSLMAIELKNNVETRLGVVLPMARFMEGPSAADLAEQVGELLTEETAPAVAPIVKSSEDQDAPLSRGQQALWFLHQLSPESTAYNIADAVRIRGPLSLDALEATLTDLVARHGAFRTTFHNDQGRPHQTVHATRPTPLEVVEAVDWSDEQITDRVATEVHKPFDLEEGPLLRVMLLRRSADENVLLFALHHVIADFWSLVACTEEFRQLYAHHATGQPLALPDLRLAYGDFTRWQRELLESEQGGRHWDYWREQLAGELPVLDLPTDRPRPPLQTYNGALAFRWLDETLTAQLKTLAEERGATLNMVLLAGYQLLLHRYSGQDDLVVGLPTSGRSRAEFAPVVGYFVNPVPVRSDLSLNPSFADYLEQVRQRTLGALEHQDFPFPELVDRLHVDRDPSRSALFQALFVMQRAQVMHDQGLTPFLMGQSGASLSMAGLTLESMTLEQWVAQFDVSLAASEADGGVSLGLQYNTDLFDAGSIETILDAYERLLRDALQQPTSRVGALQLLSNEDTAQLAKWNATVTTPAETRPVHERFAAQAAKTPSATAVVCGERSLTYQGLNEAANRLAHRLQVEGVGRGSRVGLCLPRSLDLIVGMYATLKLGAAYVPLDPGYPKKRIEAILGAAGMSLILAQSEYESLLADSTTPVVWLDRARKEIAAAPANELDVKVSPEDLIYVIFTSGSTGDPKGAGVTHRGFANLIDWYIDDLAISAQDRALVVTSHGFDLTQKNFYAPLCVGGQLHLSTTEVYDPEPIRGEIAAGGVTLFNATPSNFYPLVDPRSADQFPLLRTLRRVVLGGEPIDLARLAEWKASGAAAEVINSYGPTECSDVVTRYWVTDEDYRSGRPVPIGAPIGNVGAHVLDSRLEPMPIGATGELCLTGACLGAGYVNDPRLTAEKFVDLPTGEKAYRTGDLCRRRPDGQIEFVGRADHQVKIRGFRIELGDIEQALAEHPVVVEAVVVVRDVNHEVKQLIGYAAVSDQAGLTPGDLKAYLAEQLPPQMVPAAIVLLEELPRTPHGKLDRRRLPEPDEAVEGGANFSPARGSREEMLAHVWTDVLHATRVGRHDNFFDMGGDSLRSIEVVARLAAEGWRARPADLLQCQTIAELAPRLSEVQSQSGPITTGPAELTPIQRWFFERELAHPHHYNQSLLLETPPGLDAGAIERACYAVAQTHEALRLRFELSSDGWRQEVTDKSKLAFRREAYSDDDALAEIVAQVQASFDLQQGPLAATVFFDAGAHRPGRLLLSLHHLVTDPYSTRLLLEDLQSAYLQYMTGAEIMLPPVVTSFRNWTGALNPADVAEELSLWEALVEGVSPHLPGEAQLGDKRVNAATTNDFEWSEAETRRLLDQQEEPQVVLLAALAETLAGDKSSQPLLVDVERLGREAPGDDPLADASRTVGWLVSMHPLPLAAAGDISKTIGRVADAWRSIPHQGVGYGLLRYGGGEPQRRLAGTPPAEIRFNYLGSMQEAHGAAAEAFRPLALSAAGERHPSDHRAHLWELDFAIRAGKLSLQWTYDKERHSAEQIQKFAGRLRSVLEGVS